MAWSIPIPSPPVLLDAWLGSLGQAMGPHRASSPVGGRIPASGALSENRRSGDGPRQSKAGPPAFGARDARPGPL